MVRLEAQTGGDVGVRIGTDDAYKMRQRGAATSLIAGDPTRAEELVTACRAASDEFTKAPFDISNHDLVINRFFVALRAAPGRRKSEIIEHHVLMATGLAYSEFLKLPSENYPEV